MGGESLNIWLVIHDPKQFQSAAGVLLDLLLQERRRMAMVRVKRSGVPILDQFATRLSQRNNEDWAKWLLCRYAEIALELICYGLSQATRPATMPQTLFKEGRGASFGSCREMVQRLAPMATMDCNVWGARFFSRVVQDKVAARALEAINTQRNNLAHGRKSLPLAEIKKLITQSLDLDSWEQISKIDGELRLLDWRPWVETPSTTENGNFGLFNRWQQKTLHYLVPDTGETFELPELASQSG
jgi:hypothetical protein